MSKWMDSAREFLGLGEDPYYDDDYDDRLDEVDDYDIEDVHEDVDYDVDDRLDEEDDEDDESLLQIQTQFFTKKIKAIKFLKNACDKGFNPKTLPSKLKHDLAESQSHQNPTCQLPCSGA